MDSTGKIANLGVLSAWEPCGGILCATLPLIYRTIINMVHSVGLIIRGTSRRSGSGSGEGGDSDGSRASRGTHMSSNHVLASEWHRLGGGSGKFGADENHTVSMAYTSRQVGDDNNGYEMKAVRPGEIVVHRTFHQEM